jgi:tetratricopeptide (TPR) repeat protein
LKKQLCLCELKLGGPGSPPNQRAEAISGLRHACEVARSLCQEEPTDRESSRYLGSIAHELALLLRDDRPAEALNLARSAADQFDVLFRANPLDPDSLPELAATIDRLAGVEDRMDRSEDALRDFRRAADLYQRLLQGRPFHVKYRGRLGRIFHQIGRILVDTGRPAEALEPYRKAIELREALLSRTPEYVQLSSDCAGSWNRLGEARENLGKIADAVEAYQKCLAHQREVFTSAPGVAAHRRFLDERLRHTAWLLLLLGRSDEAAELVRERKALRPGDPTVALVAAVQQAAAILVRHHASLLPTIVSALEAQSHAVDALAAVRHVAYLLAKGTDRGVQPTTAAAVVSKAPIP